MSSDNRFFRIDPRYIGPDNLLTDAEAEPIITSIERTADGYNVNLISPSKRNGCVSVSDALKALALLSKMAPPHDPDSDP